MKKLFKLSAFLFFVSLLCSPIFAQVADEQRIDMVSIQMDLIDTKLELLNTRLQMSEENPVVMDSLLELLQVTLNEQRDLNTKLKKRAKRFFAGSEDLDIPGSFEIPSSKYVISMLPSKLFEGTMELAVERVINKGNSIELSAMATYASNRGIARYYMSNQRLEYFNAAMSSYLPYSSENITGLGASLSWRNYLLARTKPHYQAPGGVYVAPMLMYRRLALSGFDMVYNEETEVYDQVEVTQDLNVFSGGFLAGWQFVLWKVVTADVYVGGVVRLSKYAGESEFTKYKRTQNIDYSGVMPTVGVKIGIVK